MCLTCSLLRAGYFADRQDLDRHASDHQIENAEVHKYYSICVQMMQSLCFRTHLFQRLPCNRWTFPKDVAAILYLSHDSMSSRPTNLPSKAPNENNVVR